VVRFVAEVEKEAHEGESAVTNEEFAQLVLGKVAPAQPFQPVADYDPDGDCIEFIAAPDSYYAERIDPLVTVYRSRACGSSSVLAGFKDRARTTSSILRLRQGWPMNWMAPACWTSPWCWRQKMKVTRRTRRKSTFLMARRSTILNLSSSGMAAFCCNA